MIRVCAVSLLSLLPTAALAADIGHADTFAAAGDLANFNGGSFHSNPGTGGVDGANDGYLQLENVTSGNFGTRSASVPYFGDWEADGVQGVAFWLRNVSGAPFQIHFSIGTNLNFWQYNIGHVPTDSWQRVVVTFDNPADWTRIVGSGTFQQCLQFVDRIHLRHDLPPFVQSPNAIQGILGIDNIKILGDCPGDADRDFFVDFSDLNAVLADFGQSGPGLAGDVNDDGAVDFQDLNENLGAFGVDCAAP
ncbi:MAG: hypothetical protein ACTS27_04825 [Phycisphaerales bacterium]